MRTTATLVAAALAVLLLPSAALAEPMPAQRIESPDQVLEAVDPCTGEAVLVLATDIVVTVRVAADGTGRPHTVFAISGTLVNGENQGPFTQVAVDNGAQQHDVVIAQVAGPDGRSMTRFVLHLRITEAGPLVVALLQDAACVGGAKP